MEAAIAAGEPNCCNMPVYDSPPLVFVQSVALEVFLKRKRPPHTRFVLRSKSKYYGQSGCFRFHTSINRALLTHAQNTMIARIIAFSVLCFWVNTPWNAPVPCHFAGIYRPLPGSRAFKLRMDDFALSLYPERGNVRC